MHKKTKPESKRKSSRKHTKSSKKVVRKLSRKTSKKGSKRGSKRGSRRHIKQKGGSGDPAKDREDIRIMIGTYLDAHPVEPSKLDDFLEKIRRICGKFSDAFYNAMDKKDKIILDSGKEEFIRTMLELSFDMDTIKLLMSFKVKETLKAISEINKYKLITAQLKAETQEIQERMIRQREEHEREMVGLQAEYIKMMDDMAAERKKIMDAQNKEVENLVKELEATKKMTVAKTAKDVSDAISLLNSESAYIDMFNSVAFEEKYAWDDMVARSAGKK